MQKLFVFNGKQQLNTHSRQDVLNKEACKHLAFGHGDSKNLKILCQDMAEHKSSILPFQICWEVAHNV